MLDLEKIAAKIQKLLALAEGGANESESIAAWGKAQALATEYQLDLEALRQKGEAPGAEMKQASLLKPDYAWKLNLLATIANLNACKIVTSSKQAFILGEKNDVALVQGLYERVIKQVNFLCNLEMVKGRGFPAKGPATTSYKTGMAYRIQSRLHNAHAEAVGHASTALVLVRDKRTEEYALTLYPSTKKTTVKPKASEGGAYSLGYRHGDRVKLHDELKA